MGEFFTERSDRIKFYGTVGNGKFDDPLMISEDRKSEYLDNRYWWCSIRDFEKEYLDSSTQNTNIKVLKSAIFKSPANYAIIEFIRPFITT